MVQLNKTDVSLVQFRWFSFVVVVGGTLKLHIFVVNKCRGRDFTMDPHLGRQCQSLKWVVVVMMPLRAFAVD